MSHLLPVVKPGRVAREALLVRAASGLLVWFVAATALAQPASQPRQPEPTDRADQLMLVYDNQRILDEERAQLIAFVAHAVPQDRWHRLRVDRTVSVERFIDDYYDLYAKAGDPNEQPISASLMAVALRDANAIGETVRAGTVVKMPPLPVRAHGRYEKDPPGTESLRVFDANTHEYAPVTTTRRDIVPRPSQVVVQTADRMDRQRNATTTGILLDSSSLMRGTRTPVFLPESVMVVSARAAADGSRRIETRARVELLRSQPPLPCPDAFTTVSRSPYSPSWRRRLDALSVARRQEVIELARRRKLVILDTQVSVAHGHGFKVGQVAAQTLDRLGLPELAGRIELVDLTPSTPDAAQRLRDVLEAYRLTRPDNLPEGDFDLARSWIDTEAPRAGGTQWPASFDMPDALLQAMLWKYLAAEVDDNNPAERKAAWVNMSFQIRSAAIHAVLPRFRPQHSLAFVAAGNEAHTGVSVGLSPHDAAALTENVILVTHGDDNGPGGSVTEDGDAAGPPVALVAPGCGFAGLTDGGSSFASPHVAAVAWMNFLLSLDETRPDDLGRVVHDLKLASRPSTRFRRTESHGLFDAAHVFAGPTTPHVSFVDGRMEPLQSFTLDVVCRIGAMTEEVTFRTSNLPNAFVRTFAVATTDGERRLLVRTSRPGSKPVVQDDCVLASLSFTAVLTTGELPPMTLDTFASKVASVTGRVP